MDLLTIIKLALFVPFFLMLTIFAIVYLVAGYKKDLGRSIVSLLATVVATGLSLLLAKLVGSLVSGPIYSVLSPMMSGASVSLGSLGEGFIKGIIEIVLSFVLFVLFFIITLAVLKSVGKKIKWGETTSLNSGNKGTRLAGMGLRAIDAVLVCVMLLLPIYGTIAMVAPPAAAILRISESSKGETETVMKADENIKPSVQFAAASFASAMPGQGSEEPSAGEILDTLANHPVLVPYKYGPGAWVYSELSSFSMNGKQVDIATAAESLEGLLDRFEKFVAVIESEDENAILGATEELLEFARKKVVNQRWSYDMVMALVGEADAMIEKYSDELAKEEEAMEYIGMLRPLFDMSFEEYTHNAEGLLDFASWGLSKYKTLSKLAKSDALADFTMEEAIDLMTTLTTELFDRVGGLLNHSKQAVGLKRIILQVFLEERLFDTVPSSVSASKFIANYYGDGFVAEEKRAQEAVAFITLIDAHQPLDVAGALACHPLFGADAVINAFGNDLYIYGLRFDLGENLKKSDVANEAYEKLNSMLREYKGISFMSPAGFNNEAEEYLVEDLGIKTVSGGAGGFGPGDVVRISTKQGYDGKLYLIPEQYIDELSHIDVLDKETIRKYGLEPLNVTSITDGADVSFSGDGEFHFSSAESGSVNKVIISE